MGVCCSAEARLIEEAAKALAATIANPDATRAPTFAWRYNDYEEALDMSEQGKVIAEAFKRRQDASGRKPLDLDLFSLFINDTTAKEICEGLKWTNLILPSINLAFNELTDSGVRALATTLNPAFNVKKLLLGGNNVSVSAVAELVVSCPLVEHLEIPLGGKTVVRDTNDSLKQLAQYLAQHGSLVKLVFFLWGTGADSPALLSLLNACGQASSLKNIRIRGDENVVARLDAVSSSASALTSVIQRLDTFEIYDVELTNPTMSAIGDALGVQCRLKELVMVRCSIAPAAMKRFAECFGRNRTLTKLDISQNKTLNDDALSALFRTLDKHKKLQTLEVTGMPFSEGTFETLLKALEKFTCPLSNLRHSASGRGTFDVRLEALLNRNSIDNNETSSAEPSDDEVDEKPSTLPPDSYSPRSPVDKSKTKATAESKGATFYVPPPSQAAAAAAPTQPKPAAVPPTPVQQPATTTPLQPSAAATTQQSAPPLAPAVVSASPAVASVPASETNPSAAAVGPKHADPTAEHTLQGSASPAPAAGRKRIIASALRSQHTPAKETAHGETTAATPAPAAAAPAAAAPALDQTPAAQPTITPAKAEEPTHQDLQPQKTVDSVPPTTGGTEAAPAPAAAVATPAQPARRFVSSALRSPLPKAHATAVPTVAAELHEAAAPHPEAATAPVSAASSIPAASALPADPKPSVTTPAPQAAAPEALEEDEDVR